MGGLEKFDLTGHISYDPENHQRMCELRRDKVQGVQREIPPLAIFGDTTQDGSRYSHDGPGTGVDLGAAYTFTNPGGDTIDAPIVAASCDPKQLFLKLSPANLLTMEFERNVQHYRARGMTAREARRKIARRTM